MASLGFVGLGVMGSQMVVRLLGKGHAVTGYNRTRGKAQWLIGRGMKWADSPRAVCSAADIILVMVANSDALQAVAEGPDGLLAGLGVEPGPAAKRPPGPHQVALGDEVGDPPAVPGHEHDEVGAQAVGHVVAMGIRMG